MPTKKSRKSAFATMPKTPDALHTWIKDHIGAEIPRQSTVEGHSPPFAYLEHTFFEGKFSPAPADCILWANRGGGKTFLGAVATALDLVFKPGIQVRILAGSLEQATRMHQHLRAIFERPGFRAEVEGRITDRRIALANASRVELLSQSQASVRGTRPHKLRCDEVELFTPGVWEAAQLTTRSFETRGMLVRGAVECLSTMHEPHGLMSRLVEEAAEGKRTLFKWGIVDVLARCPAETDCNACTLHPECGGSAKERKVHGHLAIADAIQMKARVSLPQWNAEMLCTRPTRTDCVYPEFDPAQHVITDEPWTDDPGAAILAGMDFGFRSPTVILWAALCSDGTLYITDERHLSGHTLDTHIAALKSRPHPAWIGADPAGNNRHEQSGRSNITLLKQAGLKVRARKRSVSEGIGLVRARLAPAQGLPRLFIHKRCTHLIKSLESYHYDRTRPFSEDPVKDGPDHAADALRYLVMNQDESFRFERETYLACA